MLFLQYSRGNIAGAHQNKAQSHIARVLPAEKGQSHHRHSSTHCQRNNSSLAKAWHDDGLQVRSQKHASCRQSMHAKPWSVYLVEAVLPQDLDSIIPQRRDGIRLNVI